MSYNEKDGMVTLTMTIQDYEYLLLLLGRAAGGDLEYLHEHLALVNRLNEGNPHFTPYQLEVSQS